MSTAVGLTSPVSVRVPAVAVAPTASSQSAMAWPLGKVVSITVLMEVPMAEVSIG